MPRRVKQALELISDIGSKAHDLQGYGPIEIARAMQYMRDCGNGPMFEWLAAVLAPPPTGASVDPSPVTENPEIGIRAAVRLDDGRIIRGHRHDDCYATAAKWGKAGQDIGRIPMEAQGFVTSRNRLRALIEAHAQRAVLQRQNHGDAVSSYRATPAEENELHNMRFILSQFAVALLRPTEPAEYRCYQCQVAITPKWIGGGAVMVCDACLASFLRPTEER